MEFIVRFAFFLFILLVGAPLLFYFLTRAHIKRQSERVMNELDRLRRKVERLEGEGPNKEEGDKKEEGTEAPVREEPHLKQPTSPSATDRPRKEGPHPPEREKQRPENEEKEESSSSKAHEGKEEEPQFSSYKDRKTAEDPSEPGKEEEQQEADRETAAAPESSEIPQPEPEVPSQARSEPVHEATGSSSSNEGKTTGPPPPPPKPPRDPQGEEGAENEGNQWERFIGENLINKIGIGVLVLGIAFFVRYAIDQGWLGEVGRVAIGVLSGAALIGLAHRLRRRFRAFSSVLAGGGLAVLYFTITIAFQEYQLFSQTAAFAIMLMITGFAVLLSLLYDKQELAVIALLGGFCTPFMVSTGEGNYIVLFSYLIVLNLGMLTLAHYRHWTVVNVLSYIATVLLFSGWLLDRIAYPSKEIPFPGSFLFATAFFLIFYLMALAYKVRKELPFKASDFIILISCNALYFAAGLSILHLTGHEEFKGLFTVAMGGVNFAFAFRYFRSPTVDANLFFALVGLVLTFITLAAPIQLEGDRITLFWAGEAALLLWLSQKSGIRLLKLGSSLLNGLMLISLFMDWENVYIAALAGGDQLLPLFINRGFTTGIVCIASLTLSVQLLRKEDTPSFYGILSKEVYSYLITGFLILLAYLVPLWELYAQTELRIAEGDLQAVILGTYHFLAASIILSYAKWRAGMLLRTVSFFGAFVLILSYILYYQRNVIGLHEAYLVEFIVPLGGYLFHYILLAGVLLVLERSWTLLKSIEVKKGEFKPFFRWFATFILVFMASTELDQIVQWIGQGSELSMDTLQDRNARIGYPILWGLISFLLMWQGLRKRIRNLRIISLSLFGLTLIKLFLFDIMYVPPFGRVIAFISLGILLLVVSFMYQRIKGIVLQDKQEDE